MLLVIPDIRFGRIGAVLSALLVVFPLVGLTMHKDFYAGKRRTDFFSFYTNVSNLLVLVYFGLIGPQLYAKAALWPLIPHTEFAVMMSIMLTYGVFHALLLPHMLPVLGCQARTREWKIVCADNLIVHDIVPLTTLLYWLLCSPGKMTLRAADAWGWTLLPLGYLAFLFLRARKGIIIEETGSLFPYPFLDVTLQGGRRVFLACTALYIACILCGLLILRIIQAR